MNSPALIGDINGCNILGIKKSQAQLYLYMEKCAKENTPMKIEDVAQIYLTGVKNPEGWFDEKNRRFRIVNIPNDPLNFVKNKDAYKFFMDNSDYTYRIGSNIISPVRMWMKVSIGNLVMRGLLHVIPKLDTELLEK